tara:strand:+ start:74 stop:235 length:162 start_codon:yes stop_codon:yes gene_type:complete
MSKKAYIYFTPEELDKKFEDALVQVKEHVSVYNRKKKAGKLVQTSKQPALFNV